MDGCLCGSTARRGVASGAFHDRNRRIVVDAAAPDHLKRRPPLGPSVESCPLQTRFKISWFLGNSCHKAYRTHQLSRSSHRPSCSSMRLHMRVHPLSETRDPTCSLAPPLRFLPPLPLSSHRLSPPPPLFPLNPNPPSPPPPPPPPSSPWPPCAPPPPFAAPRCRRGSSRRPARPF